MNDCGALPAREEENEERASRLSVEVICHHSPHPVVLLPGHCDTLANVDRNWRLPFYLDEHGEKSDAKRQERPCEKRVESVAVKVSALEGGSCFRSGMGAWYCEVGSSPVDGISPWVERPSALVLLEGANVASGMEKGLVSQEEAT